MIKPSTFFCGFLRPTLFLYIGGAKDFCPICATLFEDYETAA